MILWCPYRNKMELQHIEHIWKLMARKLSGEASAAELIELEQLLRQQPEENYSMEIMQDLWYNKPNIDRQHSENEYKALIYRMKQMGIDEGKFDDEDHYINNEQAPAPQKKRFLLYGTVAILLVAAGLLFYKFQPVKEEPDSLVAKNEVSTKYGSKSSLALPDGTKVWLNAGSKLTYDKSYGGSMREVSLSGEAFFDVVKDSQKPFIIHTGKMDIRVLGTVFNVKCYPDEHRTETSLLRGSIEVTLKDRKDKINLKSNEKLIITDSEYDKKTTALKTVDPAAVKIQEPMIILSHLTREPVNNDIVETSWVDNKLVFNSETFEDIAVKMERWYGVTIDLNSEKIKKKRFTGTFENETISQALTAMQFTVPFSFTINKDHVIISL